MIPLSFQDAVGQNFGWLKERAKKEKEERKWEKNYERMNLSIHFLRKTELNLYENILVKSVSKFLEINVVKVCDVAVFFWNEM